ncbi:UNVERIFIED_CONTAM: hypothetical protein Cloal_3715 [Acetivibrio alkalicellulosi]
MKNIKLIFIVIFIFVSSLSFSVNAKDDIPKEVYKEAQEGVAIFKEIITGLYEGKEIAIDYGYKVFGLDYVLLRDNKYENIMDLIVEIDKWEFILSTNGEAIASLVVTKNDGKYSAVEFCESITNLNIIYQRKVQDERVKNLIVIEDGSSSYILYETSSKEYELIGNRQGPIKSDIFLNDIKERIYSLNNELIKRTGVFSHEYDINGQGSIKSDIFLNDIKERMYSLNNDLIERTGVSSYEYDSNESSNYYFLIAIGVLIVFLSFIIFYLKKIKKT